MEQIFPRGRGYWKINPSFLNCADTREKLNNEYGKLKQRVMYSTDLSNWWHFCFKPKVRSFYKAQSWHLNQSNRSSKAVLSRKLFDYFNQQTNGEEVSTEIAVVKSKLMDLEQNRLKNLTAKISPSSITENEKITIYHLSKGVHRNTVFGLKLNSSSTLQIDNTETGSIVHAHFSKLYSISTENVNPVNYENPLDAINNTLTAEDGESLVQVISEEELFETLKACNKKKSPGPDGLTYEFYLTNYDIIKSDLLQLYNLYLSGRSVPPKEFTDGIITLIPKNGDLTDLDNHRPISLLNTDYKIFTKIICNRI